MKIFIEVFHCELFELLYYDRCESLNKYNIKLCYTLPFLNLRVKVEQFIWSLL